MMRWFLYGSLRDPGLLARRAGAPGLAARMAPAQLPGWRRVARAAGPWPTLLRDRAGRVGGVLLAVPSAARARLAAWEGPAYRLRRVIVATARGRRAALAWIAADAARHPWRED
jgi:Gamma-glutamyl cyclotransferase, AIG2-like